MTNMYLTLSQALQTELSQSGVYAWAVSYSGTGAAYFAQVPLVSNGSVLPPPTGGYSLALPNNAPGAGGGTAYVIIQRGATDGSLGTLLSENTNAFTNLNGTKYNYQYQLFEFSLSNTPTDQGDISSVNNFGLPATLTVGSDTRGFAPGFTGDALYKYISGINPNAVVPFGVTPPNLPFTGTPTPDPAHPYREVIAPPTTNPSSVWSTDDWSSYVAALQKTDSPVLKAVNIVSYFNGTSTAPAQPASLSQYTMSYDSTAKTFWLEPNLLNGATNNDYIEFTPQTLAANIYAQNTPGTFITVHPGSKTATGTQTLVVTNTADGAVMRDLLAGFDSGNWGGKVTSSNPFDKVAGSVRTIDLNQNWNWNYNNAYNASLNASANPITYTNSLGASATYDKYGAYILQNSNTYGWSFSDLVSIGGVNPLISLSPTGSTNSDLYVKLFSNSEPMTAGSGFKPSSTGYVAPTGPTTEKGLPGYTAATAVQAVNEIQADFHITVGGKTIAPDPSTKLIFKFYAPSDAQADAATGFVSVTVPTQPVVTQAGTLSGDWNYFQLGKVNGSWTLTPTNPGGLQGFIDIKGVPVTADGTAAWYQLVLGEGTSQTVYNMYAKSDATSGAFLPITGTGASSGNFVIDQGALAQQFQSGNNPAYKLIMANAGNPTYDISTALPSGTVRGTNADDTLVGTSGADTLIGVLGNDSITGGTGIDTAVSWETSKNFALSLSAGAVTFTSRDKVGTDGTDTLNGIERMQYSESTIGLDTVTKTAGLSLDQILKVVDLYTAGLGRAPDAIGLSYWASKLADGATLGTVSKQLFGAPEAAPIYSPSNSNSTFLDIAYQLALGHGPDAASKSFWLGQIDSGKLARTDFVTALVASVTGVDKQYVANKEAVGAHFALTAGLNNGIWAQSTESGVDATAGSVTDGNAKTAGFQVVAATPGTSDLTIQILGLVP